MLRLIFYNIPSMERESLSKFYNAYFNLLGNRCLIDIYDIHSEQSAWDKGSIPIKTIVFFCIDQYDAPFIQKMKNECPYAVMWIGLADSYHLGRKAFDFNIHYALQMPVKKEGQVKSAEAMEKYIGNSQTMFTYQQKGKNYAESLDEINFFELFSGKVIMHLADKEMTVDETLDGLEARLKDLGFFRTHLNYLVNAFAIKEIIDHTIFTIDDQVVLISPELKKTFQQYYSSIMML